MEFVRNERTSVTKSRVSEKTERILLYPNHLISIIFDALIALLIASNGLSYRSTTHRAQQNKKTPDTKFVEVSQYLNEFNTAITDY